MDAFEELVARLAGPSSGEGDPPLLDVAPFLETGDESADGAVAALNAAFLLALGSPARPESSNARALLESPPAQAPADLAGFYRRSLERVRAELGRELEAEGELEARLKIAALELRDRGDRRRTAGTLWSVFFPEGVGILNQPEGHVAALRAARTVTLSDLAAHPIRRPTSEVLFTSNVLLTVPSSSTDVDSLPYSDELRRELRLAQQEPQQHWYDHPIQIGVAASSNELLYGLRGLDEAIGFERARRPEWGKLRVALSVSVTHDRLQRVAHEYVRTELASAGGLRNLDVYVFTEAETRRLARDVLAPASGGETGARLQAVFGVDGEYGRHYSFLKAIAALWQVLIDDGVRATFKFDLDQVFPQQVLLDETGATALEHLTTPLWGATGSDAGGRPVELGLLAGALVNERDIGRGLFTPDVPWPDGPGSPDEFVFFSRLPQALSTRAEMMERYDTPERDGRSRCLERIHVTGGTNGILIEALRRHRPFTPSFIGRAEDQAYIMSVLGDAASDGEPTRLTYAHAAGLIMRHDKEAFAAEAIEAARVGKLVGDDVRILYFSAYADLIGRGQAKELLDPFTGCFISRLPVTVVLLRFALRVAHAYARGDAQLGNELSLTGAPRIEQALAFVENHDRFGGLLERERTGWQIFYDALDDLERGRRAERPEAQARAEKAQQMVEAARATQST
ncbi:hypothetical protein BH24CHL6_BH24CHL6_06550 [soil metagenome]